MDLDESGLERVTKDLWFGASLDWIPFATPGGLCDEKSRIDDLKNLMYYEWNGQSYLADTLALSSRSGCDHAFRRLGGNISSAGRPVFFHPRGYYLYAVEEPASSKHSSSASSSATGSQLPLARWRVSHDWREGDPDAFLMRSISRDAACPTDAVMFEGADGKRAPSLRFTCGSSLSASQMDLLRDAWSSASLSGAQDIWSSLEQGWSHFEQLHKEKQKEQQKQRWQQMQ